MLALLDVEHGGGHGLGVVALEPPLLAGDDEGAVDAHHRVAADLDVQVGGAAADGVREQVVQVHG
jgi:hypothetical protein